MKNSKAAVALRTAAVEWTDASRREPTDTHDRAFKAIDNKRRAAVTLAHSLTLKASNPAGASAPSAAITFTFVVAPQAPANLAIK